MVCVYKTNEKVEIDNRWMFASSPKNDDDDEIMALKLTISTFLILLSLAFKP